MILMQQLHCRVSAKLLAVFWRSTAVMTLGDGTNKANSSYGLRTDLGPGREPSGYASGLQRHLRIKSCPFVLRSGDFASFTLPGARQCQTAKPGLGHVVGGRIHIYIYIYVYIYYVLVRLLTHMYTKRLRSVDPLTPL